jgi:HD-like signal output (HDOD) protein
VGLLRQLFGGKESAPRKRAQQSSSASPRDSERAHDQRAPNPHVTTRAVPGEAEFKDWLESDIRVSISALFEAAAPESRGNDANRLLESLLESPAGAVRQPPLAAQKALLLTRDPDTGLSALIALVEGDPTLGQALLRYSNSAYYATGGAPVISFRAAVQRVGLSGVHNVVLKSLVESLLCRPGGAYQDLAEKTWSHMVRTAPVARAIAPIFRANPDEAYALGLLHDAGKLVIFDRIGTLRQAARRELFIPYATLSAILRMLHEAFGAQAALRWGLGVDAAHAIATHHRSPIPTVADPVSELLFVAERMDLATVRAQPFCLDQWWRDGRITALQSSAEQMLASPPPDLVLPTATQVGDAIAALGSPSSK